MNKNYAVISDIHGNYKALEAFLNYCGEHPVDGMICLGDYVTDSPYPERIMELLYKMMEKYPCHMIRGNRECYLLQNRKEDQGWKPSSQSGCFYYTAKRLSERDMKFFEGLPEELTVRIENCPELFICHGTPGEIRGNVGLNPELKVPALQKIAGNYLLGGHSHVQEIFKWNGKTYVNPGSLGLTLDGVGRNAQFAVLHGDEREWKPELCSVPYDAESFLADFTESGLDEMAFVLNRAVKKTINTGVNYIIRCVDEVAKEAGYPLSAASEEVWEMVARRIGV